MARLVAAEEVLDWRMQTEQEEDWNARRAQGCLVPFCIYSQLFWSRRFGHGAYCAILTCLHQIFSALTLPPLSLFQTNPAPAAKAVHLPIANANVADCELRPEWFSEHHHRIDCSAIRDRRHLNTSLTLSSHKARGLPKYGDKLLLPSDVGWPCRGYALYISCRPIYWTLFQQKPSRYY